MYMECSVLSKQYITANLMLDFRKIIQSHKQSKCFDNIRVCFLYILGSLTTQEL